MKSERFNNFLQKIGYYDWLLYGYYTVTTN